MSMVCKLQSVGSVTHEHGVYATVGRLCHTWAWCVSYSRSAVSHMSMVCMLQSVGSVKLHTCEQLEFWRVVTAVGLCDKLCLWLWRTMKKSSQWHSSSVSGLQVSAATQTTSTRRPSPVYLRVATRRNRHCQSRYTSSSWPTCRQNCVYLRRCCQRRHLSQPPHDLALSAVLGFVTASHTCRQRKPLWRQKLDYWGS